MITIKAKEQIEQLEAEMSNLKSQSERIRQSSIPWDIKRREINRLDTRRWKLEERLDTIKELGMSTKEVGNFKKELSGFTMLNYNRNLGSRNSISTGFSKTLDSYVIVDSTRFNSFMSNVRGMGSLANTTDINSIKEISKSEYEDLLKKERSGTTSFAGATQTKIFKEEEK